MPAGPGAQDAWSAAVHARLSWPSASYWKHCRSWMPSACSRIRFYHPSATSAGSRVKVVLGADWSTMKSFG